jgi:hypothetical protein
MRKVHMGKAMSHAAEITRCFRVRARHVENHKARLVGEGSFEAAAVAYMELLELSIPIDNDLELSIIVQDTGTGHECCFRIDIDSREITPCG